MINNSTDANSYSWDFGDGTTSSIANPIHEYPSSPGTYTIMLAANNASNCPDTAYLTVVIEDQLIFHVPNSFTPDGDEFNNMFEPVFYSGFDPQSYTLLIYDRWGEILFESHNVDQGWNGTYRDGLVKEGTYVWYIQFKDSMSDKKRTYNGHVTLLK
jgi:gliding motility-associated-like protein